MLSAESLSQTLRINEYRFIKKRKILASITNKYISILIALLFACATNSLHAQKRFDCTVYLKDTMQPRKMVGQLLAISDSGVIVRNANGENSISWKDLHRIRFRKHHGFSRTALPIILGESAAIAAALEIRSATFIPRPTTSATTIAVDLGVAAIPGIIIYFATRNKSFRIKTYRDFKNFKLHAQKYVSL